MWMGMSRAQGLIGREITSIVERFERESLPDIEQAPGFLGTVVGTNTARGGALSLQFWETHETMRDVKPLTRDARERLHGEFKRSDAFVNNHFEIVYSTEILTVPGPGVTPFLRLVYLAGLAGQQLEQMATSLIKMSKRVAPELRGYEGGLLGADLDNGALAVVSFWETQRYMRDAVRLNPPTTPGTAPPHIDIFEIAVDRRIHRLPPTEISLPTAT